MTWQHFTRAEFACKGHDCCGGQNATVDSLIDLLDELRAECGFAIPITSGYRCPLHNQRVSTTGPDGPHTTGLAADLGLSGEHAVTALAIALSMPFTGIGINQKGAGRFLHLDLMPRPGRQIWSY